MELQDSGPLGVEGQCLHLLSEANLRSCSVAWRWACFTWARLCASFIFYICVRSLNTFDINQIPFVFQSSPELPDWRIKGFHHPVLLLLQILNSEDHFCCLHPTLVFVPRVELSSNYTTLASPGTNQNITSKRHCGDEDGDAHRLADFSYQVARWEATGISTYGSWRNVRRISHADKNALKIQGSHLQEVAAESSQHWTGYASEGWLNGWTG